MGKVILVGGFHEIVELAENNSYDIIGIIDKKGNGKYRNYNIICSDEEAISFYNSLKNIPLIITPDSPLVRKKLHVHYANLGFSFSSLVSNKANLSRSAIILEGCVIQDMVNVSAESVIGKFAKLNTMCNIMHNVFLGNYSTVAPNAVILGNVTIGEFCYIGSNSTILPNISICDNTIIGAGAVVTRSIKEPGKYVGSPARQIKPVI